jgi:hypothetical protein
MSSVPHHAEDLGVAPLTATTQAPAPRPSKPAATAVPHLWPGSLVVCLATGPSLTQADVEACRGHHVIVVNDAYRLAPWADILYACDAKWWSWKVNRSAWAFPGLKYSIQAESKRWCKDVHVLQMTGNDGLELQPTGLRTGRNSGYQAINLAVHLGARRILLLGYDMGLGPKNEPHFQTPEWNGQHPESHHSPYVIFKRKFETIVEPLKQAGVEVINCSRRSALTAFPRMTLEEALALWPAPSSFWEAESA